MKNKIKKLVLSFYCNCLLRFVKTNRRKALFIITDSHSDNCLALADYLLNTREDLDICFLVDEQVAEKYTLKYRETNGRVISAGHNFFRSNFELTTAKYVFFMHRRPFSVIKKRKNQLVVNLWHGSGYKDVADNEGAWHDGIDFDYVLVPGDVFIETKSKFFSCDKQRVLPLGYPRYDSLLRENDAARQFAEKYLHVEGKKLIIWLPTYRQKQYSAADSSEAKIEYQYDIPLLKSEDELQLINEICKKENVVILVKRHPYQKEYSCEKNSYSNILFMSSSDLEQKGVCLYEILGVTDALISDYSSVAIDYMLLDKPMAFALDDFEKYKAARGFVFENPLSYMPGHHLYSVTDLQNFIRDISEEKDLYKRERDRILPCVHNETDHYCKRIWESINAF